MKNSFLRLLAILLTLALTSGPAGAEQHRATHLGYLATRFAPTIVTPDDLRARFADPALQPDFINVLQQWGWPGDYADLFAAAATNELTEVEIPVGATMPFMSSRDHGRAICLRNVLWAGKEPISALAFTFTSKDHVYRCVTPKPCSNFFLDDLGPVPKPNLVVDCSLPAKVPVGRPFKFCVTIKNTGTAAAPRTALALVSSGDTSAAMVTPNGNSPLTSLNWEIEPLAPAASRQFCATLVGGQAGHVTFQTTANSGANSVTQSSCDTVIFGIPAILLEKADNPDPVSVGANTTYTVKVTNQGTADDENVQVVVTIAPQLKPVGSSEGTIDGQIVTLPVVPTLAPKEVVTYTITAQGVSPGDGHTKFSLTSAMLPASITAEESTTVY